MSKPVKTPRRARRKTVKKQYRIKRIAARLVLAVVAGGGCWFTVKSVHDPVVNWMKHSPFFKIASVDIRGTTIVENADVLTWSHLNVPMSLIEIKPKQIREKLKNADAWIAGVRVLRRFPRGISIHIREKKPVAFLAQGLVSYVTEDGSVLPLNHHYVGSFPVVTGLRIAQVDSTGFRHLEKKDAARFRSFLNAVRSSGREMLGHISQVDFSDDHAIGVVLAGRPVRIELSPNRISAGFHRLESLLCVIDSDTLATVRRIDLRHRNVAYIETS